MKKILMLAACSILLAGCAGNGDNNSDNSKDNDAATVTVQSTTARPSEMVINDTLNADEYVQRARLYMSRQEIGNAMRDINTALSINGKNVDALLVLADIYYAMGDQDNIMIVLNKATEIAPMDPKPIIKLAELSFLQGNPRMANAYIDKALELNKINPQAYFLRGIINMAGNDTVQALKNFMNARNQDDNFIDPVMQIAAIYAVQHNDLAIDFYDLAITMQPDNMGMCYEKALYLQDNGYPESALAIYDSLDVKMPGNYDVQYNRGYVYLVYILDYDKAISYFDYALAINPKSINALLNKGVAYEQKGNFVEAKNIYTQILRDNPNYQLAIDGLHRIGE